MIIAIEGMDGVGKTTIAKHISKKFNFKFVDKPVKYIFGNEKNPEQLENILNSIYNSNDAIAKTWFFALGNIMGIRANDGNNIVLDRHFVSNYYWNSDENCKEIYDAMFKIIGKPDLTILLYANENTRRERITSRNENDPDLLDPMGNDKDFIRMVNFMRKNAMNYKLVKTDGLRLEEVERKIDGIVQNLMHKELGDEEYELR